MNNISLDENLKKKILKNYKDYISKENFIGIGTCRVAYKIDDKLILKIHLNTLGYQQSKTEYEIYNEPIFNKFKHMLTKQMYFCKDFSICERIKPLEIYSDGCEIWCSDRIPFTYSENELEEFYEKLLEYDSEISIDDLSSSNNIGLSKNNSLVFLDYGSKNTDYDKLDELLENVGYELFENIKENKDYFYVEKYVNKSIQSNEYK